MIPTSVTFGTDAETASASAAPPSRTFRLNLPEGGEASARNRAIGFVDGAEAVKQAIYLILSTERYAWMIFSPDYGVELEGLFGHSMSFVLPEVKRRISEALLRDKRIRGLEKFEFDVKKGSLSVRFTALTVFGALSVEREVRI